MRRQSGISLTDLMIVAGIISVMASVAIPAYQDYSIRARVAKGLSLSLSARQAVAETYNSRGGFPKYGNVSYGLPVAASINGSYVSSVRAAGTTGVITIEYRQLAAGKVDSGDTVTLVPVTGMPGSMNWKLNWKCSSTIAAGFLPASCN